MICLWSLLGCLCHTPEPTAPEPAEMLEALGYLDAADTMDAVYVLDPVTQETVWHWGTDVLAAPHGGEILPNGNLLVLDNGKKRKSSRVYEVNPADNSIVWTYEATPPESFFTSGRGAVQRLPNGNTLITSSAQGWAFEVDPEGAMVWEYRCPHLHKESRPHTFRQLQRVPVAWMGDR